jgi:hypothetical protein
MAVMRQSIQQCRGHLGISKRARSAEARLVVITTLVRS